MTKDPHFVSLESMYLAAPINEFYRPSIEVSDSEATIKIEVFVLTTSFTTYLTRPVSSGTLRSEGRVVNRNKSQFIAEAVVYDSNGNEVGRGSGVFVRSKLPLIDARGYTV